MGTATRRHGKRTRLIWAIVIFSVVSGCRDMPGKPNPENRPVMPSQILGFKELFTANCSGCHGRDGNFGPAPPLNDPLFVEIISREQLARVVENGRAGTPMPPFAKSHGGSLTRDQIDVLVDGIRSHWRGDKPMEGSPPAYASAEIGGTLPGSRDRGAEVFGRACAGCHGANGLGTIRDGVATNIINSAAFLSLISNQAIRRIIITGRADLGMPTYAAHTGRPNDFQPLTTADINDLVALLASWRTEGVTTASLAP